MPDTDGIAPAPVVESSGSDYLAALTADADAAFAALDGATPDASDVASEEPAEDAGPGDTLSGVDDSPAPDSVAAQLEGNDEEPITRRNARDLVEKARAEERAAIERAKLAEQDRETHQRELERLQSMAREWSVDDTTIQEIKDAILDEDYARLDAATAKVGRSDLTIDGAKQLVKDLQKQRDINAGMMAHVMGQVKLNTAGIFRALADEAGVGRDYESEADFGASMRKFVEAIRARDREDAEGRYAALKAEFDAYKARGGSLPTPERGGRAAPGRVPQSLKELESMSLDDFERNFDRILEALPQR